MHDLADPRTQDWWGVSNPLVVFSIVSAYLYFCKSLGPRLMKNRKPFQLKTVILLYNIFQVGFSLFIVKEGLVAGWWNDYNLSCQPIDYSDSPQAKRMAAAAWWYFVAKIIELLDTIFFVLRKKNKQISFLHLYHHSIMPISIWYGVKYLPGGHGTLFGVINSFVHIIMYSYYLIAGLGPQYQKYLWWKKHLTTIQLIQFCIVFYHNFSVLFSDCNYPKIINFFLSLSSGIFFYMFSMFYYNTYVKNRRATTNYEGTKVRYTVTNGIAKNTNGNTTPELVTSGKTKEC
ncbi:unnamed protein product [Arctia plantaginis]|uniref:Elongation of very long chain fatty acids protein n=1 Tax=Arctia plantaginis TaxID=874455 RepID=A0A8S1AF41_ARCPL|nr:unnamed protein product [Arctia plantaginis]